MHDNKAREARKTHARGLQSRSVLRVLRSNFQSWRGQVHLRRQQHNRSIIQRRTLRLEKVFESLQSQPTPYTMRAICFYRWNKHVHMRKIEARLLAAILRRRVNIWKQTAFSALKSHSLLRTHASRLLRSATQRMLRVQRMMYIRLSFSRWRCNYIKKATKHFLLGRKILSLRLQRVHVRASIDHGWRTWCHHVRSRASRARALTTLARRLARENMAFAWTRWVRWLVHAHAEKLLQRGRQDAKLQALSLRHNHQQLTERLARVFETKLYTGGCSILVRVTYRFCIRNAFCLWEKKVKVNTSVRYALRKLVRVWEKNRKSSFLRRWMTVVHQVRRHVVH